CAWQSLSAADAVWAVRQFAAAHPRRISRHHAGGKVRYLAAIARHGTAALDGMYAARERGTRPDPRRTDWSGCARSGRATSARQDWDTKFHHFIRRKRQPVWLLVARPERTGRSHSCLHDVQP